VKIERNLKTGELDSLKNIVLIIEFWALMISSVSFRYLDIFPLILSIMLFLINLLLYLVKKKSLTLVYYVICFKFIAIRRERCIPSST